MTKRRFLQNKIFSSLLFSLLFLGFVFPVDAYQLGDPPFPESPNVGSTLYLPLVIKPGSLFVDEIEVTQAIQKLSSPVALIATRPTVVRVYARTSGTSQLSGINATLKAYRNNSLIGQLAISNGRAYPASVSLDSMRADKTKSFNFQLPSNWITAGSINLVATLSSSSLAVEETSEDYSSNVLLNSVSGLNIVAVPIRLNDTYGPADTSYLQNAIFRMYPVPSVNVTVHSAYSFSGNMTLSSDWSRLLNEITALRVSEGAANTKTVYYGIIPLRDSNGYTWFSTSGGVVGLGWLGQRASIGTSDESFRFSGSPSYYYTLDGDDTASHEIGHNFGRYHTEGCNAQNIDQNYPYSGGIIGQYGYQYSNQTVIANTANDIMNYCSNQWISDYTYQGLYANQVSPIPSSNLPNQDTIYIRGKFEAGGEISLLPIYAFEANPFITSSQSEYVIQFIGENGEIVAEYPVEVLAAEEKEVSVQAIHALLPKPGKPFVSIQLAHSGEVVASREQAVTPRLLQMVPKIIQESGSITIDWGGNENPAMVRYSQDGGLSWTTLSVDSTLGRLQVVGADLPAGQIQFEIILADGSGVYKADWTN